MSTDAAQLTTEFVTSADGTPIAYSRVGTGPALVLVDGALCFRDFGPAKALAGILAPHYTVYFYDRRGRGESGDIQPYSAQKEIDDLAAVIAAAGPDAFLMGQSSGGALAMEVVASGVRVAKLAVFESPYVGNRSGVDDVATLRKYLAEGHPGKAVAHFMVKMVGAPFFVPFMMRLMPKVWNQLKKTGVTLPYDALVMDGFVVPTHRLARIQVPTIILGGSKGDAAMKKAVREVAAAIPGAQFRELEGQSHQVSEKALEPVLREFFGN
ncbi:MAG: hydrolase [Glaciihabitans sp.]|nr:hydrolase [Glaciihabitans sp.]